MRISVCMGLYNGEKYIEQQLASVLGQTRQPDEVILCDDCSSDGTVAKVQEFIQCNGLEETWKLYCNSNNKGYPANFYQCMKLCDGDIVFFGDQDDIWEETKLEKMSKVFEIIPDSNVVACRYGLIDSENQKIYAITETVLGTKKNDVYRVSVHDIFYRYQWPGMVLAYRNSWYRSFDKYQSGIPHDIFICAKAAEEESFFQLDQVLAYHRRHENNTAAEEHRIRKLLNKKRKLWEIEKYLSMLEEFEQLKVLTTETGKKTLDAKLQSMRDRCLALRSGQISKVLKMALKNRYHVRLATVVCDVMIVKQRV